MGIDVTACPGCGKELVTGRDTGDKTVHLGKEWHKACFETAFPSKGPAKVTQEYAIGGEHPVTSCSNRDWALM